MARTLPLGGLLMRHGSGSTHSSARRAILFRSPGLTPQSPEAEHSDGLVTTHPGARKLPRRPQRQITPGEIPGSPWRAFCERTSGSRVARPSDFSPPTCELDQ
eukprot:440622-Prymnesium_polylepis.1